MTFSTSAQERIQSVVEAIREAAGAPGIAVAIVQDGISLAQGYGVREKGTEVPVNADTLFVCASTTKAFTTTVLACLVDEKKLSWDDLVRKWLPEFHLLDPHADALVTVRDLVTHRTGLPRHDALWYHSPLSAQDVLRRIADAPSSATFRGTYQYQNICYTAASHLAARAAGVDSFEALLQTRLLKPLGMTRTPLTHAGMQADDNRASPHQRVKGDVQVTPLFNFDSIEGAGALHTSARQMLNWLNFHLSGGLAPDGTRIIGEEALRETYRAQISQPVDADAIARYPTLDPMCYALGWSVWQYPLWGVRGNRAGIHLLSHGGYLDGFRAQVALVPSEKIGLAVFANVSAPLIESLRSALLDILLDLTPEACPDWSAIVRADVQKAADDKTKKDTEREEKRKTALPLPLPLAAFAGAYTHGAYGEAVITESGGSLQLAWNGHETPLRHEGFVTFTATTDRQPLEEESVRFTLGSDGKVSHLVLWDTPLARVDAAPTQAAPSPEAPLPSDAASEASSAIQT